jgi:hypothetical protein
LKNKAGAFQGFYKAFGIGTGIGGSDHSQTRPIERVNAERKVKHLAGHEICRDKRGILRLCPELCPRESQRMQLQSTQSMIKFASFEGCAYLSIVYGGVPQA